MFLPSLKKAKKATKKSQGFTLIELLVVIGILAILLAIVLIAVNPPRQFILARNTQRRSDALAILNGVGQFFAENGAVPSDIPTGTPEIIAVDDGDITTNEADICGDIVGATQRYLAEMPVDPLPGGGFSYTDCTTYTTGYFILRTANNRITVSAPSAEDPGDGAPTISITR